MKTMSLSSAVTFTTLTVVGSTNLACSPEVDEPSSLNSSYALQVSTAQGLIAGYHHMRAGSRFALGAVAALQDDGITERIVGEQGVFATNRRTGWVAALPNATSALAASAPLMDPSAHNEAVRSYFVSAGLPEAQIANVVAHGWSHTDLNDRSKTIGDGYTTVLSRTVDGLRVPESFAWARMNIDHQVVTESVLWPDVPTSIVAQAKELAAAVASGVFSAAVASDGSDGSVVIHHTAGYENSTLFAATYDFRGKGAMAAVRHLDKNGVEVALPADHATVPVDERQ